MTLDEAIKHAEEVAEGHEKIKCIKAVTLEECKCAEEHRQLAEWLKDYKRLLEQEPKTGHNCNEDYADCDQFVCSECGIELQDWHRVERNEDDGDISYHDYVFRFCPNCGARMESEG